MNSPELSRLLLDLWADLHDVRVLRDPAPAVAIKQFADNGIELQFGAWIEDPQRGQGTLRSDLYCEIWHEFRARGIEIPHLQREGRVL